MDKGLERKYSRKHIGTVRTTTEGYSATCIDGGSKVGCILIKIEDYKIEVGSGAFAKGNIKYPYHPSVYSKGFFGVGPYSKKTHEKLYKTWSSMLLRAYDCKFHMRHPTYKDVTVCKEWHNLQVFGKWFEDNYIEGFELDKDLLSPESKIYSPDTCVFIPHRLNSFLTNNKADNTSGHAGVYWHKRDEVWVAAISAGCGRLHLGYFSKLEEAVEAYKEARSKQAALLKKLYKDSLSKEVLDAIR